MEETEEKVYCWLCKYIDFHYSGYFTFRCIGGAGTYNATKEYIRPKTWYMPARKQFNSHPNDDPMIKNKNNDCKDYKQI